MYTREGLISLDFEPYLNKLVEITLYRFNRGETVYRGKLVKIGRSEICLQKTDGKNVWIHRFHSKLNTIRVLEGFEK